MRLSPFVHTADDGSMTQGRRRSRSAGRSTLLLDPNLKVREDRNAAVGVEDAVHTGALQCGMLPRSLQLGQPMQFDRTRRRFITLLGSTTARAQPPGRTYRKMAI